MLSNTISSYFLFTYISPIFIRIVYSYIIGIGIVLLIQKLITILYYDTNIFDIIIINNIEYNKYEVCDKN